jgi:hypothetical protein
MLTTYLIFVFCSAHSSTLKMDATCSSETQFGLRLITQRYVPEDRTPNIWPAINLELEYVTLNVKLKNYYIIIYSNIFMVLYCSNN